MPLGFVSLIARHHGAWKEAEEMKEKPEQEEGDAKHMQLSLASSPPMQKLSIYS